MAKQTIKYVVTTEEGTFDFANLGLVGKYLGKKVTKKDLEAGKYPMVTLEEVEPELTVADLNLDDIVELEVDEEPTVDDDGVPTVIPGEDGIEVPDDSTGFLPDPELDQHTLDCIAKVEKAINDTPEEDAVLFDALCDLEDSLRDSIALTKPQADLLTAILTGTLVTSPALTNTSDTDDSDTDSEDGEVPPAPPVSEVEYPEVGDFKDEKAMKKFIKGLSDQSLQEWCILEGAEWKANDHESINRMRMAMAIKAKHFPTTAPKAGKKSKSKYASYSTEDLVSMALENDIEVPDDKGDNRILRMYTIMALRKAGLIE